MAAFTGLPTPFHLPTTPLTSTSTAIPNYLGIIEANPTGTAAWTLPAINASPGPLIEGALLIINNRSAYAITLTPTAPDTINGLSTLVVNPVSTVILEPNGSTWMPILQPGGDFTNVHITDTTQSVSCMTGAFTDAGGAGISKDLWVCGAGHFGYTGNVDATAPVLAVASGGTDSTTATIQGAQTANITLDTPATLPGGVGTLLTQNSTATLTNKTITDATDSVTATGLWSGAQTNTVSVSAAANPTSGQVLTATSATTATWQTPSNGLGGAFFWTNPGTADITSTIANGTTWTFNHAGPAVGSGITASRSSVAPGGNPGNDTFTFTNAGTYTVEFQGSFTEAAQSQLWYGTVPGTQGSFNAMNLANQTASLPNSTVGRSTGTAQLMGFTVMTVAAGSAVQVQVAGSASAITPTVLAGGTQNPTMTLKITRLA
jgi:hypothetical protein